MSQAQYALTVRAQMCKLGADGVLLATAIAWISQTVLKIRTTFEIVALQPSADRLMGNYEEVLLGLDDAAFVNSRVHRGLQLERISQLLHTGPLHDLALGSRSILRQELLRRTDALKNEAHALTGSGRDREADVNPALFTEPAAELQSWLWLLVSERLQVYDVSAWQLPTE